MCHTLIQYSAKCAKSGYAYTSDFSGNPGYDDQVISGKKYRTRNNDKNKPQAEDQASQQLTESESKPLFAEAGVAKCAPRPIK